MVEICINRFGLSLADKIGEVLTARNVMFNMLEAKDNSLSGEGTACENFICSHDYAAALGDVSDLVEVVRGLKAKKIIVIEEAAENFAITTDMGDRLIRLAIPALDDAIAPAGSYALQLIASLVSGPNHVAVGDHTSLSLLHLAKKVAETDVTVFINGPTGTGKEVLARFVHNHSYRADKPFVAVNCAAIPENMLEAILFGHEKGAFTGASTANKGIFRAADGGTLLLDEISEMPLSLQAKLLRALQEKSVTPIGSHQDIEVDVRVLATTNRDIPEEVRNGNFREDLFYRLNVFPLNTVSLSERPDDIIPISSVLLQRHCKSADMLPWLDDTAVAALTAYDWPGNVRELENVLQRALVLNENGVVTKNDILTDLCTKQFLHSSDQTTLENLKAG